MEQWQEKLAKIMEMEDPHKALIEMARLVYQENLSLEILDNAVTAYTEKHNVEEDEMAFYPNGERVLSPEVIWGKRDWTDLGAEKQEDGNP